MKTCPNCSVEKPLSEFYSRRNRKQEFYCHCKECNKKLTMLRQQANKRKAVSYKGGSCCRCGFSECLGALQFHHISEKDGQWNNFKLRKFDEKFKKELDKCILLCANCHAAIHTSYCTF